MDHGRTLTFSAAVLPLLFGSKTATYNSLKRYEPFLRRIQLKSMATYELYKDDAFVSPAVTQIRWTNHLLIMSKSKSPEERHFYMELCIIERYSKRELERQLDSSYYERYMLSAGKQLPEPKAKVVRRQHF